MKSYVDAPVARRVVLRIALHILILSAGDKLSNQLHEDSDKVVLSDAFLVRLRPARGGNCSDRIVQRVHSRNIETCLCIFQLVTRGPCLKFRI